MRKRTTTTSARLFPFAGELQGALADGFAEGLVRREGGEPFGLRLALVAQEVNQTQCLTLRSQLRSPRLSDSKFSRGGNQSSRLSLRAVEHCGSVIGDSQMY